MTTEETIQNSDFQALGEKLRFFTVVFLSGFINASFLIVWLLIQWGVDVFVISRLELSELKEGVLLIFQWGFAISTLIPILYYTVLDVILIIKRTTKRFNNG